MTRRDFIRLGGLFSAALLLPTGKLYAGSIFSEDGKKIWEELIDYARWSASPHNIQPWKVKVISDTVAELYYDPSRLIPYADKGSKFMTVGLGIFIENMSVAAASRGSKVNFDFSGIPIDSSKKENTLFGRLNLVKTTVTEPLDRELIKKRKTSRLHFQNKPVEQSILDELKAIAKEYGQDFNFSDQQELVEFVVKLNTDTLFYDLDDDQTRTELEKWLRYSEKDAASRKDGLWSKCMNFPGKLMDRFFNHHASFDHGLVKKAIDRYYQHSLSGTRTVGWIQGSFTSSEDCISNGRMMARIWLTMAKYNVYLHPFGSVITNPRSHEMLKEKLNTSEEENKLWLLMRLGYSEEPERSFRLETHQILIS
jgi:hypothetical protein